MPAELGDGAQIYLLREMARGEGGLRCEVSGREAVECKGTGVQEVAADDAVYKTCSWMPADCTVSSWRW
jgi:hypothetical protein